MFVLRDYQKLGVDAGLKVLLAPKKKAIVVAPTGGGKSIYIAKIVEQLTVPVLVLQPSKELLKQNYHKYISCGGEASIYCASLKTKTQGGNNYTKIDGEFKRCDEVSKVTFATIGSIKKEIEALRKMGLKHIIIDEVHLQTKIGSQIRKFIKSLKVTNVLGLTATPIFLTGGMSGSRLVMINRTFGTLFREIAHVTQIKELVDNKYWAPLKYKVIANDTSELKLNTAGSDYTEHSQKEYYKSNGLNDQIVEEVKRLKSEGRKRILIFVPSIAEAELLYGSIPNSAIVHSKLTVSERDFMVDSFSNGDIPVIINVNILGVGYDNPEIDAIITGRPTSSVALAYQQLGRGVRIHPEGQDCIIVDFSGNVQRFGRIEELTFEDIPYYGWGMFNGSGQLLSDYPIMTDIKPTKDSLMNSFREMEELAANPNNDATDKTPAFWFGKHNGKSVKQVIKEDKGYIIWMLENFGFDSQKTLNLKKHIEIELQLPRTVS
jgi:DNA repair protein RadD